MVVDREDRSNQWGVYTKVGTQLPLRENPLRFAMVANDGSTSNSWRTWVEKEGDAYICCRDSMSDIKISLHKSGRQHITCTDQSRTKIGLGQRYWNTWREPPHQGPVFPSFKLIFPSWGVRLDKGDRTKSKRLEHKWDDNQVLIEQDDQLLVTVDFIVRDEDFLLDGSSYPIGELAVLPAPLSGRPNRRLFIVVGKHPDEHFRGIVQRAFARLPNTDVKKIQVLRQAGEVPVAWISGYGDEAASHAYMIVVPVTAFGDQFATPLATLE